jgi:hypothetical protein
MPILDFFWAMLMFFLFFAWIWVLITVFIDIFRSHDLNGWEKALWVVFVLVLPLLGVLVYLIARGGKMQERQVKDAANQQQAWNSAVQEAAGSSDTTADQLTQLANLHQSGALTDDEYAAQKAKVLNAS